MGTMRRINNGLVILPYLLLTWFFFFGISQAADTLQAGEGIRDWESLDSSGRNFRLQFFTPDFSTNRYLGIRYIYLPDSPPRDVVWVANQEDPLMDSSGVLNMTQDGKLVITDRRGISVTINSEQPATSSNTSAILLNSGNLVIKEGERIVWQSFDYPQDTFLAGMKLGMFDLKMGRPYIRSLTSWLSPQAAVQGAFTLGVDPNNAKQLVIWRRGDLYWRSGIWNRSTFSNLADDYNVLENFNFSYLSNENESYFTFTVINDTGSWIKLNSSGQIESLVSQIGSSTLVAFFPCDDGDDEGRMWKLKGCVTPKPSGCSGGDMFSPLTGYPNGEFEYLDNSSMGPSDCREICLRNCSCNAYGSLDSNGTGCILALSLGNSNEYVGGQLFRRNNSAGVETRNNSTSVETPNNNNGTVVEKDRPRKTQLWSIVGPLTTFTIVSILCYLGWKRCCFRGKNENGHDSINHNTDTELFMHKVGTSTAAIDEVSGAHKLELSGKKGHELLLFNFSSIEISTDHFSEANKLGQGGFGPVYKAWDLYREGGGMELIDPAIEETCSGNEVMRRVQIGLLCVQESAVDRPTMSDVVCMLNTELMALPAPKQPAFTTIVGVNDADLLQNPRPCSINDVTISEMEAR